MFILALFKQRLREYQISSENAGQIKIFLTLILLHMTIHLTLDPFGLIPLHFSAWGHLKSFIYESPEYRKLRPVP
jgi:hypothetical protein